MMVDAILGSPDRDRTTCLGGSLVTPWNAIERLRWARTAFA
jgi:hypothetical protein